ncbi:hypothetical protein [Flavobacterium sp.]|uniref:hypothetical protein n=1 Tax=Flavobacterium sp. TaxID=239 RepID=UPI00261546FC|nr:hypothetical protein [Flavobacterium sp.]
MCRIKHLIDKKSLSEFTDMFEYGNASTVNWLISKLKIIKSIIDNGHFVSIEGDDIITLKTHEDLKIWISKLFDEVSIEEVYKT